MSMFSANTAGGLFGTPQNAGGLGRGLGTGLTGGLGGAGTTGGNSLFGNRPGGLLGTTGGGLGGSGGLFGSVPSSQGGGLFGNTGTTGGGLFQSPQSGLGTQQKPAGFGGTSGGLFGQSPSLGGGLFGQSTQSTTPGGVGLFSKPTASIVGTSSGLFGTQGGGLGGGFNGMLGGAQQVPGTMIKFDPVKGKDTVSKNGITQNVDTRLHCYTAMPHYDQKSLEELRFEDYQAGRKVGATGALFPGTTGLGGGISSGGLFNQSKPLGGGLSGGGMFSQQQQQSQLGGATSGGGLFSQQQKLGGGLFNTPGQTKLGGLNTGLVGTTGGGLFSQQQTSQPGGLFNQPSGGLFNQSSTGVGGLGALGQQQTQLGGGGALFRTPLNQTGGLGGGLGGLSGVTSTLGGGLGGLQTSQASGGLFNKPLVQTGGLGFGLGQTQTQGGLNLGTGGLGMGLSTGGLGMGLNTGLGMGQQKLGGLGGIGTTGFGVQTGVLNQGTDLLTLRQKQAELNQKLESVANEPFGDSPLFRTALLDAAKRSKNKESSTSVSAKVTPTQASHYKLNVFPSAKFRPMTMRSPSMHQDKSRLFQNLDESVGSESTVGSGETFVPRKSIKKLIITPKVREHSPVLPDSTSPPVNSTTHTTTLSTSATPTTQAPPPAFQTTPITTKSLDVSVESPEITLGKTIVKPQPIRPRPSLVPQQTTTVSATAMKTSPSGHTPSPHRGHTTQLTRSPLHSHTTELTHTQRPCGVTLVRPGYYTVPSLDELDSIADDGHCPVEGFTVGNSGFGEVHFPGQTDVYGMNLDELVTIGLKEVAVYPDDRGKPPVGQGLNKKAIVKLERNWPVDKSTREVVQDLDRLERMGYAEKLRKSTTKIGATFLDYVPETGTCVFEVDHFSKYKLADDDSDEDEGAEQTTQQGGVAKKLKTAQTNQKSQPLATTVNKLQSLVQKPLPQSAVPSHGPPSNQSRPLGDDDEEMSEEDQFEDAHDLDTPTQPHALPVPPSQQLVSSMGVDTRTLQTMKASFFSDEAVSLDNQTPPTHSKPPSRTDHRPVYQPLLRREPAPSSSLLERQLAPPIFHRGISPLASQQLVPGEAVPAQSAVFMAKHSLHVLVSSKESITVKRVRSVADIGLTMGRSFRVGWGPNWTLAHSGFPLFHSTNESQSSQPRPLRVVVEQIHINDAASHVTTRTDTEAQYQSLLSTQLEHTEFTCDKPSTTPLCTPSSGHALLHALTDVVKRENFIGGDQPSNEQLWRVIQLTMALWGQLPNDSHSDADSYDHQLLRKQALYQWLKQSNEGVTESEVAGTSGEHYLEAIFSLVCGQQLGAACRLAQKRSDHKLALLLSQAVSSTPVNKTFLQQQLKQWEGQRILGPQSTSSVDFLIEDDRLKLYMLLAGEIVWDGGRVNICHGLDWKRVLALHLCYHCPPSALIGDVIDSYRRAFNGEDRYAPPPLPPYVPPSMDYDEELTFDTCYHLLYLYCDRGHSLELTLDPSASTQYPLDYRISWFLWSVLVAMDYTHLHPTKLVQLQTGFASQLERSGLWEWAGFVLLHITDPVLRDSAVQRLLTYNCTPDKELSKQESFIVDQLHVPLHMVHSAKAQQASQVGRHEWQAYHLLVAERWNDVHDVILHHLATDAIISDITEELLVMLEQLSENSAVIQHWENGGSVYLDFLHVSSRIHQLAKMAGEPTAYELDEIHIGLEKLAHRIGQLPCQTPMEILCQAELAKRTASYTRIVLNLKELLVPSTVSITSSKEYAPTLSQLPMPSDYALTEYRTLLHPYVAQFANTY